MLTTYGGISMNKRNNVFSIILLSGLIVMLSGCAAWQLVGSGREWKKAGFAAVLPQGWMRSNYGKDILLISKDGELLQYIRIASFQVNKEKELPLSKKKFTDEMLPEEVAETILNEISIDKQNQNFTLLENDPAEICNRRGFKVVYACKTPDNLKVKSVLYGFKEGRFVYIVQYLAAQQYYFDKDLEVFNQFVRDLRLQ